jgi:hypothetical protein
MKSTLRGIAEQQTAALQPRSEEQWGASRETLKTALAVMLDCQRVETQPLTVDDINSDASQTLAGGIRLSRPGNPHTTQAVIVSNHASAGFDGKLSSIMVVVDPGTNGNAALGFVGLLKKGAGTRDVGIVSLPLGIGEGKDALTKRQSSGFFTTYNEPALVQRVHDVLNAVAFAQQHADRVNLVGVGAAGPIVLLARPFCGKIARTAVDANGWDWPAALPVTDEWALPVARRYGGMKAYAALAAPDRLFLHNTGTGLDVSWVEEAYRLSGKNRLKLSPAAAGPEAVAKWVNRK